MASTRDIARTPRITNLTLSSANTQYAHTFDAATKYFSLQCRTSYDVRLSFTDSVVAGPTGDYFTIKANGGLNAPELMQLGSGSAYFASGTAGVVVEILEWN